MQRHKMSRPRRDPYAFADVDVDYATQIELRQDVQALGAIVATMPEADYARELLEETYTEYIEVREARGAYVPTAEIQARAIDPRSAAELAAFYEVEEEVLETEYVGAAMSLQDIMNLLDVLLPEELAGLDITPGVQVGRETKGRVYYDKVWIENGKVKTVRKGESRTLGYTPRFAKKKYRTRRRRKRLTKRDMYILEVLKANPEAGALALML